jgi:lysophospholipase L1-like esterase
MAPETDPVPSRRRRGRRALAFGTLVIASVVIAVLLIDLLAFFVFDWKAKGYAPGRFFVFSPVLGHFHRPSAKGRWYRYGDGTSFLVETNRFGFADSERAVEKKRPRIALLGDSTTEFWEVEEPDRGQYRLEALLGGRFEVLNFGVRAYGTDQTYLLFKYVGRFFSPDIAVYLFCINDLADNASHVQKPYFEIDASEPDGLALKGYPIAVHETKHWLDDHSLTYRLSRAALSRLWGRMFPKSQPPLDSNETLRPYKRIYDPEDAERMEVTLRLISRLNALCRANGVRLLVVEGIFQPAQNEALRSDVIRRYGDVFDFDKVTRILEQRLTEEEIPFSSLARAAKASGLRPSELTNRGDPVHLNKDGIALYAQTVAEKLRALGWLEDTRAE